MVMYLKYLLCSIKTQITFGKKKIDFFFFLLGRPGPYSCLKGLNFFVYFQQPLFLQTVTQQASKLPQSILHNSHAIAIDLELIPELLVALFALYAQKSCYCSNLVKALRRAKRDAFLIKHEQTKRAKRFE